MFSGHLPRTALIKSAVGVTVLALAAILVAGQLLRTQMLTEERVSLDYYIDGTIARPFAYRVFLPLVMRGLNAITPACVEPGMDLIGQRIASFALDDRTIRSGPENKYPRDIFWLALLQLASLIGYAVVAASLYSRIRTVGWLCRGMAAPLLLLFVAPFVGKLFGHIYDFTGLFFMSCLMWAMATNRHGLYLAIFAISCLNKETTILMSVAYAAVFFQRIPLPRYVILLVGQITIFLVIYLTLRVVYAGNPGIAAENHLPEQFDYYKTHFSSIYFCCLMAIFLVAIFVLTIRWRKLPQLLRRSAIMTVPFAGLFLYGARPGEVRNLYEILPLASLIVLCTINSFSLAPRRRDSTKAML